MPLKKGDCIQLAGRLRSSEHTPNEETTPRRSWEVVVSELVRVEPIGGSQGEEPGEDLDEEIPY